MGCLEAILWIAVATGVAHAAPAPGSELVVGDLGWPATTDAATVKSGAPVLDGPNGKRIGTLARGASVTWKKLVAGRPDRCRAWVELAPRGWVCAKELTPGAKVAADPAGKPITAPPTRDRYAAIRKDGADTYDSLDQLEAGTPAKHVGNHTNVAIRANARWQKVNGKTYVLTDQGWIATDQLWWMEPSPFAGIELAPSTSLAEIGWAVARRIGAKIAVRDTPDAKGKRVRELSPRDRVTVLEDRGAWTRIGPDEWVDAGELRRIAKTTRPDGVAPAEKWIDVDLDHQTLVAYEGDTPVFTTLVATGKIKWPTPTGIYRVHGKDEKARMRDGGGLEEEWDVADVPHSVRFRKNFALHGTYWHDGFGRRRSHGCVNLSTADAKRIYDWVTPDAPPGWTSSEILDGTGTPVRIRSAYDPQPRWRDYEGRPVKDIATR